MTFIGDEGSFETDLTAFAIAKVVYSVTLAMCSALVSTAIAIALVKVVYSVQLGAANPKVLLVSM